MKQYNVFPECNVDTNLVGYLLGGYPKHKSSCNEVVKAVNVSDQFAVATHSPLLLNDFELEDIFVFEKGQENATIVKKYFEEDFPQYEGDLLPGQLWLDGEIGGKRWLTSIIKSTKEKTE